MTPAKFDEIAENIRDFGDAWIKYVETLKGAGRLTWAPNWVAAIRDSYESKYRPELKLMSCDDDKGFLDRHKIAAALTLSVIRSAPLVASFGERDCLTVRDANTLLALDAGAVILFGFGLAEAALTGNDALKRIYDPAYGFDFPEPGNGNLTYQEHFANTLRQTNASIQPFMMSHLYFLLQRRFEAQRALELKIHPAEFDPAERREALNPHLASTH